MKTIWRVSLPYLEATKIATELPAGAEFLACKAEKLPNNVVSIWFEVETDNLCELRHFFVTPSGSEIPTRVKYLGTAVSEKTPYKERLVMHLFESLPL